MYLSHFELKQEPFSSSPDPEFLWMGTKQAMTFKTLKEGILDRDGCVLLTGDIGTGKTILIKSLAQLDHVAAVFVTANDPSLNRLDFCNILAAEFGLNRRFDRRQDFYASFADFLLAGYSAYRKVLIIIDEAHQLNPDILREAVSLSNLKTAGRKPLKIFFVGQPELSQMLSSAETRDVLENITAHCRLEPLTEDETRSYVDHRLKVAGRQRPLFSADAVKEIHTLSRGYPRLINIVGDHALVYGYSFNLDAIDGRVVRECSRDLSVALDLDDGPSEAGLTSSTDGTSETPIPQPTAPPRHSWRPFLYMAAAVALAGLAFLLIMR
ncbi:MAG: ExeA family protein [Hyphomicrobiales bacterium]